MTTISRQHEAQGPAGTLPEPIAAVHERYVPEDTSYLPTVEAPAAPLPHNDLDYSAAEYGHLTGVPVARTLNLPGPEQALSHDEAMSLALDAARQGIRGANPLVGAVITDSEGHLLHVGYHRGAGTPHAEADALAAARAAGTDLTGARMYVSLEPCNHTGRTGPCSHAVAEAGISELYYAYSDDTENAAGGAAYLRSRGVTVHAMEEFANASYLLNERWFIAAAERRPFITAKSASTLDGFIAAADGTSKWITGPAARIDGHLIRHRTDAVMIGTRTTLMDDPTLDARDANGERCAWSWAKPRLPRTTACAASTRPKAWRRTRRTSCRFSPTTRANCSTNCTPAGCGTS